MSCDAEAFEQHGGHDGDHAHGHMPPLRRLWRLVVAEKRDINALILFSVATGTLTLATPLAVQGLVNSVAFGGLRQPILVLSTILFISLSFAAAITALQWWLAEMLQRRIFVRVVADMAYRLPRVRAEAFDSQHGPELVNRFFDVFTVQKVLASMLLDGVALVLQALISMILLAFYHPYLLGFDIMLLFIMVFLIFVLGRGAINTSIAKSRAKYEVAGWLEEMARHPISFKTSGVPDYAAHQADNLMVKYLVARSAHFRILMRQIVFALIAQTVVSTLLLGLGGWLVIAGQLTLGQLVASELMVAVIVGAFAKMGKHFQDFYSLMAAIEKLGHIIDLPLEDQSGEVRARVLEPASLRLCNVGFRYDGGRQIFSDLNWHVRAGERVALMSRAGSGKSTLAALLFGTRRPTGGHIELDGVDIRDLSLECLRDHVAVVSSIEIFEGSIYDNVQLGRPWVGPDDVREALNAVGLLQDVRTLPHGMSTMLIAGGSPLSNTQMVRLMIARAIASRPRLMVLDETIDALDEEERRRVLRNVCNPSAPWTLILITRWDEIAEHAGRIVTLDPGDNGMLPEPPRQRLEV